MRTDGEKRVLSQFVWGWFPSWSKDKLMAQRLINARAETVHEKPSFQSAFRERRCIIPVNGWFEWRPENGRKHPYWIRPEDTEVFSLAGIWEGKDTGPGSRLSFVILTTDVAPEIADIHHRQPVILDEAATKTWLDPNWDRDGFREMARKGCELGYHRRRISRQVNDPLNNGLELLEPLVSGDATAAAMA